MCRYPDLLAAEVNVPMEGQGLLIGDARHRIMAPWDYGIRKSASAGAGIRLTT
ncbi:MAG TPA: hypothetical protein VGP12_11010 [Nitrosospira sp.]|nr:hypothetical protein [Nitrosospira sp.]